MNRLLIGNADKTDLLLQFLESDSSVTIIDPTGNLARAAANQLPRDQTERALYFDPADAANPIGLNVLKKVPKEEQAPLTDRLCAVYDVLFPEGETTLTRRHARLLFATGIRLLLENNGTLLGLLKLLTDADYAKSLQSTDPVVASNWKALQTSHFQNAFTFLHAQLGSLFMFPLIRNIIGQPRTLFRNNLTVIVDLDRAKIGDTAARLLGGLLIAKSTGAVVINDYGFFACPLPLAEARFTLALNFLDELPPKLRQPVLGIEDKYVFKTSKKDAEELAFYVGWASNPSQIIDLDPDQVRTYSQTFRATRPPSRKRLAPLKRRTRACHTRPRILVENEIKKFLK